jgi:hypothetical protein
MPDMVRAYLNSFLGLHTILCTRGPGAAQRMTQQAMQQLCDPSFRLFACDVDERGQPRQLTEFKGIKSRYANSMNDVSITSKEGREAVHL